MTKCAVMMCTETAVWSVVKDGVSGVDEVVPDRVAAAGDDRRHGTERVSCILCMECIGNTEQLQQHLLMVSHSYIVFAGIIDANYCQ